MSAHHNILTIKMDIALLNVSITKLHKKMEQFKQLILNHSSSIILMFIVSSLAPVIILTNTLIKMELFIA